MTMEKQMILNDILEEFIKIPELKNDCSVNRHLSNAENKLVLNQQLL